MWSITCVVVLTTSSCPQYYRVQVGIQSPQGISTVRDVLRRFSDFLKLFAAVSYQVPVRDMFPCTSQQFESNMVRLLSGYCLRNYQGQLRGKQFRSKAVRDQQFLGQVFAKKPQYTAKELLDMYTFEMIQLGSEKRFRRSSAASISVIPEI